MPDKNKLEKLGAIGYRVRNTCRICAHFRGMPGVSFGSCLKFTYEHEKHGAKQLSVHVSGNCPSFRLRLSNSEDLERSGFLGFLE